VGDMKELHPAKREISEEEMSLERQMEDYSDSEIEKAWNRAEKKMKPLSDKEKSAKNRLKEELLKKD
jgi:hypothetical protein